MRNSAVLLITALMGCRISVEAPADWPDDGCVSAESRPGLGLKQSQYRLLVDDHVSLDVDTLQPENLNCGPAILYVAAGFDEGRSALRDVQASNWALEGITVAAFDARGRGNSDGEEDHNGATQQNDLGGILRWLAALENVDPTKVIVFSRSFGGVMTSGALARHQDLKPLAWVDYESPADISEELLLAPGKTQDRFADILTGVNEDKWWSEREPVGFIGQINTHYDRIQGAPDHALGHFLDHAELMLNSATLAPSVRLNGVLHPTPTDHDAVRAGIYVGGVNPSGVEVTDILVGHIDRSFE